MIILNSVLSFFGVLQNTIRISVIRIKGEFMAYLFLATFIERNWNATTITFSSKLLDVNEPHIISASFNNTQDINRK